MPDAPFIPSPQTIADYPVLRELTPNTTYLADRAGRRVVLKRLEDDCLLGGELHPLIHDRLSRVRELAHVGVANLLGVEADDGQAYLVWEYVEGTPVVEYARTADARRREAVARELIGAVEMMHALGIVHGEVHGGNVFVTPAGRVKLTQVSPLLYNETRVDVEAAAKVVGEMGVEVGPRGMTSLRELAGRVGARDSEKTVSLVNTDEVRHGRRGSLIAAALLAFAGAVIALGVWYWTNDLSRAEELAPTPRT